MHFALAKTHNETKSTELDFTTSYCTAACLVRVAQIIMCGNYLDASYTITTTPVTTFSNTLTVGAALYIYKSTVVLCSHAVSTLGLWLWMFVCTTAAAAVRHVQ